MKCRINYSKRFVAIKADDKETGILEIKEYAGKPYLSLNIKSGEPEIDAYVYINEEDVLNVRLGQNVTFAGTIEDKWPEDNGFYALEIEDVTLIELGEIPTPTTVPLTATSAPATATSIPSGPTQELTTSPQYVSLLMRVWTGVDVYYGNSGNKTYVFEILGGSEDCPSMPSGRGVKVRFPSGSEEWKDRTYLVSSDLFFVLEDDPALSAMQWYEYYDCP